MIDFPVKGGLYQVEVANLAGSNTSGQMVSVRYPLFLLGDVGSEQFLMQSSKNLNQTCSLFSWRESVRFTGKKADQTVSLIY